MLHRAKYKKFEIHSTEMLIFHARCIEIESNGVCVLRVHAEDLLRGICQWNRKCNKIKSTSAMRIVGRKKFTRTKQCPRTAHTLNARSPSHNYMSARRAATVSVCRRMYESVRAECTKIDCRFFAFYDFSKYFRGVAATTTKTRQKERRGNAEANNDRICNWSFRFYSIRFFNSPSFCTEY